MSTSTADIGLLQEATDHFESMIVSEAKRLQSEGKPGLQILPGVSNILERVKTSRSSTHPLSST